MPLLPIDRYTPEFWISFEEPLLDITHLAYYSCQKLLDYYVKTWFCENDAKFNRIMWNQFKNSESRTNNNAEAWNGAFSKRVKHLNPTFFYFLDCLRNEQQRTEDSINSLSNGNPGPSKGRKYAKNEGKLSNLWLRLEANSQNPISSLEFLDKSHCVSSSLKIKKG
jgi:hypothetical protein